MQQPAVTLTLYDILSFALIAGALGGIVYVCTKITIRGSKILYDEEDAHLGPIVVILIASIVAGAASAVGLLFVLHFLQLLKPEATIDNEIFLISASLIAGIAAQRLIPRYTQSLEAKVDAIDRNSERTREVVEETSIITKAQQALIPNAPLSQKNEAIELLKGLLTKAPLDRTATIYLGRLYRTVNRMSDAVSVLDAFIAKKEQAAQLDKDYADVHYNRACYYAQAWVSDKDAPSKMKAIASLKLAIQYSTENKADAVADKDFAQLREEPEMADLLK